jgi:hypothetical protein
MKHLFLTLFLLMSGSSWAQWSPVAIDVDGTIFNFDYSTLRKDGELRKIWTLSNFVEKDPNGVMSSRVRMEYDCKNELQRFLSFKLFSDRNATGKVIESGDISSSWKDIAPDTAAWKLMQTACKKAQLK